MMKKAALAVSLLAGLGIGVGTAQTARPQKAPLERNSTIIIELDRSLDSLTKEGVKNVQKYLYESIKANVTSNIDLVSSYSVLNNAIAISINDSYIEDVKSLPGVKSVTVDKLHFVSTMSEGSTISISRSGEYGGSENVSATTMNKGSDTNDGEGTVIAILDNEFYFKGKTDDNDPWNHVAFTDLGEDVVVKFKTRPNITATHAYTDTNEGEKSHSISITVEKEKPMVETSIKTSTSQAQSLITVPTLPLFLLVMTQITKVSLLKHNLSV